MTLTLPTAMVDEMVAHSFEDLPNECCGIIAGDGTGATKLYRIRNSEASPFRYNMHPLDLKNAIEEIDDNDWQVLVVYHSHVASEAYPSPTDVRLSQWPGLDPPVEIFPDAYYVLVSLKDRDNPAVRAFRIHAGEISEEALARS